ncbi:uncharacterized protein LOC129792489 isoform X2 [Lutzomyia longipalpis]|nr:uncharacterized protein LOC129792489 isoform X2 [Lutzomyia longipalpis]
MTFEARDSAAKVVPARFKMGGSGSMGGSRSNGRSASSSRRATGVVSTPNGPPSAGALANRWEQHMGLFRTAGSSASGEKAPNRQALTAALIHFSKTLGSPDVASPKKPRRLSRSDSVPNLLDHHHHCHHHHRSPKSKTSHRRLRNSSLVQRTTRELSGERFLHPGMLKYHRQALSVDDGRPFERRESGSDSHQGSQTSMGDRTRRSDTAKKHILARQKPIEREEVIHSPRLGYPSGRRRSSTASDASAASRRTINRRASSTSRTPSIDSRSVHSPERSPRTPHRVVAQISTPSVERDFRSQLSISSEPMRVLSCQSSIDPCVPEESPEHEDKDMFPMDGSDSSEKGRPARPDSLILDCNQEPVRQKFLYRSKSSKSFKKPKARVPLSEFHQIYFISSSNTTEDGYDSIEVIDERRMKNFGTSVPANSQQLEKLLYENSAREEGDNGADVEAPAVTKPECNEGETSTISQESNTKSNQITLTIQAEIERQG